MEQNFKMLNYPHCSVDNLLLKNLGVILFAPGVRLCSYLMLNIFVKTCRKKSKNCHFFSVPR